MGGRRRRRIHDRGGCYLGAARRRPDRFIPRNRPQRNGNDRHKECFPPTRHRPTCLCEQRGTRKGELAQELADAILWTTDNCSCSFDDHGPLQKLFVLDQNVDDRVGVADEIVRVEFEFLELRIFADQVLDRVFKPGDDRLERCPIRWFFDVQHDIVVDTQFLGDRQGILG